MRVLIIYFISIVVVGADTASFKRLCLPGLENIRFIVIELLKEVVIKEQMVEMCPDGRPNCGNREEIKVIPDPDGKTYKERCCPRMFAVTKLIS